MGESGRELKSENEWYLSLRSGNEWEEVES